MSSTFTGSGNEIPGEYPEFLARFYDIIYHQVRDGVDNKFYLERISETRGRVLEVGVGTGRLFTEALRNGADIYGIDISRSMLEVLLSKLDDKQKKRVALQNIIDFDSESKFDLILAPFRVFMHLSTKEQQLQALDNVFNNLNPGGRFIFDLFIPDLKMLITGLDNFKDFDGEYEPGYRVRRFCSTRPDLINQLINLIFRIEWNDSESQHSREWKSVMRYFFRYELEHLIERSKFSRYKIIGDFNGNDLDNNSREFIIICYK